MTTYTFGPLGSPLDPAPGNLDQPEFTDWERSRIRAYQQTARAGLRMIAARCAEIDDELGRGEFVDGAGLGVLVEGATERLAHLAVAVMAADHRVASDNDRSSTDAQIGDDFDG
jgi:hypothetical protein